jgi:hypothetical protein
MINIEPMYYLEFKEHFYPSTYCEEVVKVLKAKFNCPRYVALEELDKFIKDQYWNYMLKVDAVFKSPNDINP